MSRFSAFVIIYLYLLATIYLNHAYPRVQIERRYEGHGRTSSACYKKTPDYFFNLPDIKPFLRIEEEFQIEITDEILATRARSLVTFITTSFMHSVTIAKRATILCHSRYVTTYYDIKSLVRQ